MKVDPIRLEIYKHLFASIAEEMGTVLRKSSYSANIKERRDFSCAVFDAHAEMIAQAAHIPVHLGSMPLSVLAAVQKHPDMKSGDVIILNDPYAGGTHLPDITLVSPVFYSTDGTGDGSLRLIGYVSSRAHHADVGGMTAGSMPVAREIFQEGLILPPIKLIERGEINEDMLDLILANVRTPLERRGDLLAQIAANRRGALRLEAMVARYGLAEVEDAMTALLEYTERMTRNLITTLPDGTYRFQDAMDDDGLSNEPVIIQVAVTIRGDEASVDFTNSALQQQGSINAVYAITLSAVYYVFRCLLGLDVPNNSGCLKPVKVIAPPGTVVNALSPAAVAGGNVETSQRIVDVLLGALSQACPDRVPAASQGTMNNLTIGGMDVRTDASQNGNHAKPFTYYETIGGGMGARSDSDGSSAVHSHMTNTLNTPTEALEYSFPLRVIRYGIRQNSGGKGRHHGGEGIIRELQVLTPCQVTLLSERRVLAPYGLEGGEDGMRGENYIRREGEIIPLSGKGTFYLKAGDILCIHSPGGGGFGKLES